MIIYDTNKSSIPFLKHWLNGFITALVIVLYYIIKQFYTFTKRSKIPYANVKYESKAAIG